VYEINALIMTGLACLIVGGVAGMLYSNRDKNSADRAHDIEEHLAESQQQLKDYQQEVTAHFSKTAELVRELNQSYRDVHTHLAEGAQNLAGMNVQQAFALLQENPDLDLDEGSVQQPLDYSPKKSPNEKGMLEEDFGLEKVAPEEDEDDILTSKA
jgi:uncharacterized membrane-anchored protein YhcB (DUF1043 family)